ncbi:helix-turn-helix domain-containing protein [Cellulomonas sp. DKR-3]|uniref:Helix-turn-helix domain-containing protein n=1 Tax=Cellulomonas fulva TaxID=2835530 RepID=A0ABS5TWT1_9CELL|nr:helix-turn-helix domain-containing protein [Cellulomonas fulva]MBT0993561.1 helix-turn-helix domain-containing protein [Cellulomonas fulva]
MRDDSLGAALRHLRTSRDLTLERLAELSTVSARTISDIERGVSTGPQRRTVELLCDALDLSPDDRTAVLSAARAGRVRGGTSGPPTSGTPTSNPPTSVPVALPRAVADFTGRGRERELVAAHLASGTAAGSSPVVVVSGPPGFGKTALAVTVATELAAAEAGGFDEVHFVDLRGYTTRPMDAAAVVNGLVHAVEPQAGAVPREAAAATWQRVLGGRRVLVVLDNAATEDQVRAAIPATGPAAVLVTSRGTLAGLEDVLRVALDQLPAADSLAMLGAIVPASQRADQDLERLAGLCGHVPLALRIAGNRVASRHGWTVDDLAARLDVEERRIDGLRAGDLEIRATIALSYDRLSDEGRRAFRRLAHLRGGTFSEPLAARLTPTDLARAEEVLDGLVDLGLVQPAARGRYHLHDLLRLFARGRLHDEEPVEDRVAVEIDLRRWLLGVTILAGRWFEPGYETAPAVPDRLVALTTLEQARSWLHDEAEHWLVALQDSSAVGEHRLVVDVAESLHWFSDLWAHWGHWHEVFALGVQAARALGDDSALATQLGYLAWAETHTRLRPEHGLALADEAAAVARRAGDVRQQGWAALYAFWACWRLERYDEALRHGEEAGRLLAEAGDAEGHLQARRATAMVLSRTGRYDEAIQHERSVLATLDAPGAHVSSQSARITRLASMAAIARSLLLLDRSHEAVEVASRALDLLAVTDVAVVRSNLLETRTRAFVALGRLPDALAEQRRLVALREQIGNAAGAAAARDLVPEGPGRHRPA